MFTHEQLVRICREEQDHLESLRSMDYVDASEFVSREITILSMARRLGVELSEYKPVVSNVG